MHVELKKIDCDWLAVKNTTLTTIGKESNKYPSTLWRKKLLLSEHSPIRVIRVNFKFHELKYWVSVHFVRHHEGVNHYVTTQRTDRTGIIRDKLYQDAPVDHEIELNAQAIINISRKRLCSQASRETREAWRAFLERIKDLLPDIYAVAVKDCIYRGYCYEFQSCGYYLKDEYKKELEEYRKGIREND